MTTQRKRLDLSVYLRPELRAAGFQNATDVREAMEMIMLSYPGGFTESELDTVREALKIYRPTPKTAHLFWAEVADASPANGELVAKLRRLHPAEVWALIKHAEGAR